MGQHDLGALEANIRLLSQAVGQLGADGGGMPELIKIIHRPGWTSLAEYQFVHAIVHSMLAHTNALQELKTALLAGSRAVGAGKNAAVGG